MFGLIAARPFQQLIARQHPARVLDKGAQQTKFAIRQRDHLARRRKQQPQPQIHPPTGKAQIIARIGSSGRWCIVIDRKPARLILGVAAQHRADTRQQFARVARLGQIIIRAQFQPDDPVNVAAHRAQHDHRGRIAPKAAQCAEAILARHHHIEHDQIDFLCRKNGAHLKRVSRNRGGKTVPLQKFGDQRADTFVIIDDQNAGALRHSFELYVHFPAIGSPCLACVSGDRILTPALQKSCYSREIPPQTAQAKSDPCGSPSCSTAQGTCHPARPPPSGVFC